MRMEETKVGRDGRREEGRVSLPLWRLS
jgi:hypothetical protein